MPPSDQPRAGVVQAGLAGDAQREVERGGGHSVGRVRGEHEPLGGDAREQLDHVHGEEAGQVVEDARVVGQQRGQDPLVADGAVGEDQDGAGVAQGRRPPDPRATGGIPRPAWIRIGTPGLFGEREDVVHLRAVELEALGARVQLHAARAVADAALGLGDRVFGGVQPAERDQAPVAFPGPRAARGRWGRCSSACARGRAAGTRRRAARPPRRAGPSSCSSVSERPSSSRPRWVCASITSVSAGRSRSASARNGARAVW